MKSFVHAFVIELVVAAQTVLGQASVLEGDSAEVPATVTSDLPAQTFQTPLNYFMNINGEKSRSAFLKLELEPSS